MFLAFLDSLRAAGIPASLKEHLLLLEALDAEVIDRSPEQFYYLSRAVYVKDEALLDRFDRVFEAVFRGALAPEGVAPVALPEEWLRAVAQRHLTPEQRAAIESLGDWDAIMRTLRERLAEQQGRHQGGSKWIGTGGTSAFGNAGYNPEGVRIGGDSTQGRAVKLWEQRAFRDLDRDRALGTRNLQVALRRLRRFAREGAADELDIDATIDGTARQGWLDVRLRPERRNAVKLLLFLDVGGSMDPFVTQCEQLFSAATSEFRDLEFFYFHNCVYEGVWKENRRRFDARIPTLDLLHTYGRDYKLLFVGDAAMSPYEITHPGGSVEHHNDEAGALWLRRLTEAYPAAAWLNPAPVAQWVYTASTALIRDLMADRMYPLTIEGIDAATRTLARRR
ncbi:VWA domain-containing protein [Sphingomonas sp. BK235]|uniref:vWA domain-containing protein n=1 Tax=Sphingomonas sp. BK235 TaxID=2512131 RepID=UPI00104669DE|nr:VWA domain-containing protein [Sphingomonas sp. BK235]TCP37349.1 hypothetical protein EV292_101866 [Sphingomonas sp. BK235]